MNFENFREQFTEDVKQKLFESGIEANVSTQEVTKLNESYHAITVTLEGRCSIFIQKIKQKVEDLKNEL